MVGAKSFCTEETHGGNRQTQPGANREGAVAAPELAGTGQLENAGRSGGNTGTRLPESPEKRLHHRLRADTRPRPAAENVGRHYSRRIVLLLRHFLGRSGGEKFCRRQCHMAEISARGARLHGAGRVDFQFHAVLICKKIFDRVPRLPCPCMRIMLNK